MNISSQGTSLGFPGAGIYAASKAAVDAVSDTWANELAEYGIRSISVQVRHIDTTALPRTYLTLIQPGNFRTEVLKETNIRRAAAQIDGYTLVHGTIEYMSKNMAGNEPGDPAKGARNIVELVTKPEIPLRFVVGDDASVALKAFYEKRLAEIEATRDLGTGTSFA